MTKQFIIEYATGRYDSYTEFVLPVMFESKEDFAAKLEAAMRDRTLTYMEWLEVNDKIRDYRTGGRTRYPDFDIDAAEQQRMKVSWSTGSLRIGEYTLPWDMDYENSDIEIFTLQEWIATRAPIQAQ